MATGKVLKRLSRERVRLLSRGVRDRRCPLGDVFIVPEWTRAEEDGKEKERVGSLQEKRQQHCPAH